MTYERFEYTARAPAKVNHEPVAASKPSGLSVEEIHDAIDTMAQQARPDHLSERNWHCLLKDLHTVAEHWLDIALGCGWTPLHLFGCPAPGSRRMGRAGLAVLLDGRPIESIDAERIVITNRIGAPNVFYRQPPGCSEPIDMTGAVLIWDAVFQVRS